MLNNKGLVEFVNLALNENWGYVWGTFGQVLTESLLNQKLNQYSTVRNYESFIRSHWLGRKTSDCVGLIKAYYWTKDGIVKYDSNTDVSANTMYNKASEKGEIGSIPDIPGLCVWKQGHIGVYIGNGEVIEAHGTKYGVIKTPLHGTGATAWSHWLKCPFINYESENLINKPPELQEVKPEPAPVQTINQRVLELQRVLNRLGIHDEKGNSLEEDGVNGSRTKSAVKRFQYISGIEVDGVAGQQTWNALNEIEAKPLCKNGSVGIPVRYIQWRVGATIDGQYGPKTAAAVKSKIESDGVIGPKGWSKLIG